MIAGAVVKTTVGSVITRYCITGAMITIIGTGHVFDISVAVMNLVKHIWPDAVLVELDVSRYNALNAIQSGEAKPSPEDERKMPWVYRRAAKYQNRMAEDHSTDVGKELLTAVNTGKLVGAEIGFIDTDAYRAMGEMWEEMPLREKMRYAFSTYTDNVRGSKGADKVAEEFGRDEEGMMEDMRRRYPTMVRKLIDERNDHMAEQIRDYADRFNNIVVVCGDAHVEGISQRLGDLEIRKVRLADLMDPERLRDIHSSAWNHEGVE